MSFLDRFRRKALTGTPAVVEALSSRQTNLWPLLGGGSRQRIVQKFQTAQSAQLPWLYEQSPAVRSVIDLIVRNIGQLDLRLYEEIDEANREPRPDHAAAMSMRYPNPEDTSDHYIRSVLKDFLIFDNAYALKWRNRASDRVVMERIPAARVEVISSQLFRAEMYRIHQDDGTFLDVTDPTDVIHWRGENPIDPRMGVSRLDTLRAVIAEDAALQQAIVELANSGLQGPAWVSRPLEAPAWSNEARERAEEDIYSRLSRHDKRPALFEEGMELHNTGVSPRDAQMLEIRRYVIEQVATLYGVPLGMVGLDDDVDKAQSLFYSDTLPPYCEEFTRWVNHGLLVAEYGLTDYCFEFNLDEKHMGDDRLKSLTSASGRPVLTTNESRAMVNRPPIKGGDELVTPANVIVGDNPKPSVDVMPIQDPNKPPQDGSYREDDEPKALQVKQDEVEPPQVMLPLFAADLARQHRYVDEATATMDKFYRRIRRLEKAKGAKAADWDRFDAELAQDLHRLTRSIVEREGGIYVARLAGNDFDMRQVENYLKQAAEGAAEGINAATRRDAADMGFDAALDRAQNERAHVAAASVGTRSTIFAREEAAKQSPNPERRIKTWIAHTARHGSLHGASVPLNASWGGLEPGSQPNCRCSASIR